MKNKSCFPEFFLGANTPCGFFSLFDNLYSPKNGWFCHILKGGPGTGKSTLMKKISKKSLKKGKSHEIIKCSSDPKSLDAIILNESKTCIVDGTAPHIMDPIYPGVSDEIINLGDYWDSKALKNNQEILTKLFKENSRMHKTSQKYLNAFGYAFNCNSYIVEESLNYEKLNTFCKKISKKLFKKISLNKCQEKLRFVSSVTPDGYILLSKTIDEICEKLYVLDDKFSIVGSFILEFLRKHALSANYSTIVCPAPFSPKKYLEALFIPDLKVGIIVKNQFMSSAAFNEIKTKTEKIYTKRFIYKENLEKNKNLINFNNKICKEFLEESVLNLYNARKVHDEIESIYSGAMNYSKINKITQKLESF